MAKRVSSNDASKPKGVRGKKTTTPAAMAPVEAVEVAPAPVAAETTSAPVVETVAAPIAETVAAATPAVVDGAESNGHANHGQATAATTTEQIAQMAYFFWQERGCPVSTGVEDWLRAERELQQTQTATA